MAQAIISRKSNAQMLALLRFYYPSISAFIWNVDGSSAITSDPALSDTDNSDVVQIVTGSMSWNTNEI